MLTNAAIVQKPKPKVKNKKMKKSNKRKTLKRIKESITELEYKKLMNAVRDESIRPNRKDNLLRTYTILYFTGLRLNELQEMKLHHIRELLDTGTTKLLLPKTKSERKLFVGEGVYQAAQTTDSNHWLRRYRPRFQNNYKRLS